MLGQLARSADNTHTKVALQSFITHTKQAWSFQSDVAVWLSRCGRISNCVFVSEILIGSKWNQNFILFEYFKLTVFFLILRVLDWSKAAPGWWGPTGRNSCPGLLVSFLCEIGDQVLSMKRTIFFRSSLQVCGICWLSDLLARWFQPIMTLVVDKQVRLCVQVQKLVQIRTQGKRSLFIIKQ